MSRSLHVRLDDASVAALGIVRASGLTDSEAVRIALREAADRRCTRFAIAEEIRVLVEDSDDRREMRAVSEEMSLLAPDSID